MSDHEPKKSEELIITQKIMNDTRSELESDIASLSLKMDARFNKVDARFNKIESDIAQVRSDVEKVLAAVHRVTSIVEEQENRNKFALDGYASLDLRAKALENKDH